MTTEAELKRAEERGKETGIILTTLANLETNMNSGFKDLKVYVNKEFSEGVKRFDKIEERQGNQGKTCVINTKKLDVLFDEYTERKEMKKFVLKTAIKKFLPAVFKVFIILGSISGVGYACFK